MKIARLALAVMTVAVFAACSSDVTGPSNAKPTTASSNMVGYGGNP